MQIEQELSFGPYRLDLEHGQLWRGTQTVKLTPKALAVLRQLVQQSEQVVSKEELFQTVWADTVVSDAALTFCIQELRRALRDDAKEPRYIETVHRRGFRFLGKVVSGQPEEASQKAKGKNQKAKGEQTEQKIETERTPPPDVGLRTPDAGLLSQDFSTQALSTQHPAPLLLPQRSWSRVSFALLGLVLLVSVMVSVQYLSLPTPNPQSSISNTQPPTPNTEGLPLPDKPSIVVIPFTNMSGDPEQEYFSDGITEDLTTDLSKLSGLFVIARNSAFTYKGKAVKVQDVSRELGVRYVLEGSVRKTGSEVRVSVQLIDALSGQLLWAERYDRPLQDIFALQGEIKRKIVAYLALRLTKGEQERIWSQYIASYTGSPEAYDSYMRGREYLYRNSKELHAQSRQLFERAIALDPTYAVAYVGLGFTYLQEWMFQWSQDLKALEQAFAFAQNALALDDSLPTAHLLLGRVYQAKQQHEQAVAEAERAVVLAPNYATGYATLGQILNAAGRPEDAIEVAEKALRLDPRNPVESLAALGNAYRLTGRYEEAIAILKKLLNFRNHPVAHILLAIMYSELGREEEARAEAAEILRDMPNFSLEGWKQTGWKDQTRLERDLEALRKAGLK